MNKKAFTLIEIIIVIVIIGSILLFAIPEVVKVTENSKIDSMLIDAKNMVELTKNYIISGKGKYPDPGGEQRFTLKKIDPNENIKASPFGSIYDRDSSQVVVTIDGTTYLFTVTLIDKKGNKIKDKKYKELSGDDRYSIVDIKK